MKIYTKSGDKGETSLVYGMRVSKSSPRVNAYGTCDEANSQIGVAVSFLQEAVNKLQEQGDEAAAELQQLLKSLHVVQTKLFHVGNELSTPKDKKKGWPIHDEDVTFLEQEIDRMDAELPPLKMFVLPGGHPAAAAFHLARTIARRAERLAVAIPAEEEINPVAIKFLNRLSDFLFVCARHVNHKLKYPEPVLHQD